MSTREFDPSQLDVQAFAKDSGTLHGRRPLRLLHRLTDAICAAAPSGEGDDVSWSARGEQRTTRGALTQTWLHLTASARLQLECQRCLQPVETALDIDRWFQFVAGEDVAAQIDADSDDDVLALTRALDLHGLVEDELLLDLPLVPRHDVCPAPLLQATEGGDDAQDRPNPFAALATLKRGGSLN